MAKCEPGPDTQNADPRSVDPGCQRSRVARNIVGFRPPAKGEVAQARPAAAGALTRVDEQQPDRSGRSRR